MGSSDPTVSVGMPVFNGEPFLEQALDSIVSQSFDDLELVISDNASTDGTGDICNAYATKDDRIRYFRLRQNYGIIHNFNTVFRLSRGKYFKWASSDDICGRDYLAKAVEVLEADPSVVLAWAKTVGIDEHGNRVPTTEVSDLNSDTSVYSADPTVRFRRLLRNIWWANGPFYGVIRASALADTRWIHPRHMSGDQILLAELSLKGRFYEIPDATFLSRTYMGKTSRKQRTLRDRAKFVHGVDPKGIAGLWQLYRGYPQRIAMYASFIRDAPLTRSERLVCYGEVMRAVAAWGQLRFRQARSGTLPWGSRARAR